MRTKILFALVILALSFSVTGQTGKYKLQFKNQRAYSKLSKSIYYNNLNNDLYLNKSMDLSDKNLENHDFSYNQKHCWLNPLNIRRFHNSMMAEEYPGSSIFYAKRPYLLCDPDERSFLIKPDKTVKYYLLIKEP